MFSIFNKLGWFFRQEWRRYSFAILLLVVAGILEIIPPMLVGQAIDTIALGQMSWSYIGRTVLLLAGITVVVYIISYIWGYRLFGGAFVVERLMRGRLMRHFLKMTPTFYERNRTGDLMARSTNDLQAVAQTAGFGILTLLDSTLWMGTLLVTMSVFVSWKLTLAAVLPLPVMALLVSLYGGWIHARFMKAQDAFGDMNEGVLETVSGIRVIRAYTQERAAERQFAEVTQDVLDKNLAVVRIEALFEPTIKILVGISYMIGLGYGAYLVFHNELTIGALVAFNVYLGMMIWPMFAIGELINIMQRGNASLDRVNETLGYKPDVPEPENGLSPELPGRLAFHGVTFRYPSSAVDNLREVTFTLEPGQTLGIVGKTGSGKSTLIKQLLREYPPGEGTIELGGVPIERIDMSRLKSWLGYVPQEPFLFSRTIRRNIHFGGGEGEQELQTAVETSAFAKDLQFLPQGLDTMVGEKGVALSGGQKQRVSLARALIANPRILLLDDAMSAVDARTESQIIANIRNARAGKTTIIATHRLSAVLHADLILVLEDGRIVEQGTHSELLDKGGWYREQFERQQVEAAQGEEGVERA
ncbi:ATP-binding cassette, subfamily B [Paenibacillus sp. UNCCL117]|uniref:ABC transporter ATP-binding protein n=1 Tax=unclassified Paenibacillus TaxID=185978 RepID=UPI00088AB554|nr:MULTISPECIES: ABC transporter transmembrane domain-containing protein [unclassified Paenibacillus]SDD13187.1 ATP-binding cassette, subfamily B [Paenibacillus sp. cl123]SFW33936.1 ATP-binding cassette, subfamily B [Paenibacillus sp. UNCCL117]